MSKAEQVFEAALAGVESQSIRDWATCARNREHFVKYAQTYVDKPDGATRLTIAIVSLAIGL